MEEDTKGNVFGENLGEDQIEHGGTFRGSKRLDNWCVTLLKRPLITDLLKAIRSCGVSFNIFIKKEGFDFTSLVGDDKKTLLNKLPDKLCTCQPLNYYAVVQQIWKVWISNSYGSYHCLCTYRILRLCMTQLR